MARGAGSAAKSKRHSAAVSVAAIAMAQAALLALLRPLWWASTLDLGTEATTLAVCMFATPPEIRAKCAVHGACQHDPAD